MNITPLQDRIRDAVEQLDQEAIFRSNSAIPRIVALSIRDGLCIDEFSATFDQIKRMLDRYSQLSAIALFWWTPEENIFVNPAARWFLAFNVFHNSKLQEALPLPTSVFDDGRSKQHFELDDVIEKLKRKGL